MSTLIAILLVNQLAPIVWYLCKWGVTLWQIYSVINLLKLLNKLHTNNILFFWYYLVSLFYLVQMKAARSIHSEPWESKIKNNYLKYIPVFYNNMITCCIFYDDEIMCLSCTDLILILKEKADEKNSETR
jgi:hypothetical protein